MTLSGGQNGCVVWSHTQHECFDFINKSSLEHVLVRWTKHFGQLFGGLNPLYQLFTSNHSCLFTLFDHKQM